MGKYYQTIKRMEMRLRTSARANTLVSAPRFCEVLGNAARSEAIRAVSERLAPLAVVDRSVRLAVAGCCPGDGASTVAVALAMDLSQRMSLRTILIDAHVRHPSLHLLLAPYQGKAPELLLAGSLQVRSAGWPQLEVATCCVADDERHPEAALNDFEELLANYQAAVIDLGVPRLDARMLPLARPADPLLLVVRYGSSERRQLANTVAGLRGANRSIAGVIFNAKIDPVPRLLRRFLSL